MAGEVLKKRREELGVELRVVADLLKIRPEYINSIEDDCFEKLPVAVYTIGYIRCYAAYLKVDPEPIISFYTGHLSQPKSAAIMPVASSKKKAPVLAYVILALLIVVAGLAVMILRQSGTPQVSPVNVKQPQQAQAEKPLNTEVPVQPAGQPSMQVQQPYGINEGPSQQKQKSSADHRLEIKASDLTWMHIALSSGRQDEVLLRPGMTKEWTFAGSAVLKLGNAGGIRITLDGRDLGVPGGSGQVVTLVLPEGSSSPPVIQNR